MSKAGETKDRIMEILSVKNETLTDISAKLELAPSTVSQHLKEMLNSGMIRYADDRPRRWKYYEINYTNPIVAESTQLRNRLQVNRPNTNNQINKFALPIAGLVIILAIGIFAYTFIGKTTYASAASIYMAPGSTAPQGSTIFSISDAPTSYNITALYLTIKNVSIYSTTTGKWYYLTPENTTFNLIALRNISKILSGANLAPGNYRGVVIEVANLTAVVNGTTQKVFLPSNRIILLSSFNISNKTTNWINLDFNLQKSLHITADGKIMMFPVIDVTHKNDTLLNLNKSFIIVSRVNGTIRYHREFGMDFNGDMMGNYTMPENTLFKYNGPGRFIIDGSGAPRDFVSGRDCLLIENSTTQGGNYTAGGPSNSIWPAQGPRPMGNFRHTGQPQGWPMPRNATVATNST